jgi:hypothetical protein
MRFNKLSISHAKRLAVVALTVLFVSACSTTSNVPFTVQSDPLGAQVMMQLKSESSQTDWIYLGNTPLTTQRKVKSKYMSNDYSFVVQVMKEGYSHQAKEWSGLQIKDASKGDNRIYWNPQLVEIGQ